MVEVFGFGFHGTPPLRMPRKWGDRIIPLQVYGLPAKAPIRANLASNVRVERRAATDACQTRAAHRRVRSRTLCYAPIGAGEASSYRTSGQCSSLAVPSLNATALKPWRS